MVNWGEIGTFERYPKINDVLQNVGEKLDVTFQDDGKDIPAAVLEAALKEKGGKKKAKPKNSIVFVVKDNKNNPMELWLSAQNYTSLVELKRIKEQHNGTLAGARVRISRVSKGEPDKSNFKFEAA